MHALLTPWTSSPCPISFIETCTSSHTSRSHHTTGEHALPVRDSSLYDWNCSQHCRVAHAHLTPCSISFICTSTSSHISYSHHDQMHIVCQMLFWRTKNWPHFINICDTVTTLVPLHSVHQAPSYGPNVTLLAWFLRDLAYLSMLFILEVLCTACSAEHLKNK